MGESRRGAALTFFAVIFVLLAIQDLLKPFRLEGPDTGFVFLGHRLIGPYAFAGALMALFLLTLAVEIWRMRRHALPLAYAYAVYVVLNLVLFTHRYPAPTSTGDKVFGIVFSALAIGGSWAVALILTRRRAELA